MRKLSLLLALAAVTAPAQKVHEEFDESIDFSRLKTYAIRNGRIRSKHPSLDNSLVQKKIENSLRTQLSTKGLQETSDRPDLVVTYVLGAVDRRDVDLVPAGWRGMRTRRVAHRYTQGTLVIDLKDGPQGPLIWRATCTDTGSNPNKIEDHIDKDVKKAFEHYPPKKK